MTQVPASNAGVATDDMANDEPARIVAYFLTSISAGRIKENLAPNCRLRWIEGMTKSTPTMVNEFLRFHVSPQYTHVGFENACKPCDHHTIQALQQRYYYLTEPTKKQRRTCDLNAIGKTHAQLRNRASSFTEDDNTEGNNQDLVAPQTPPAVHAAETQLTCESPIPPAADTMHIERTPPPSTNKVHPTTEHERITTPPLLHYIEALGALHSKGLAAEHDEEDEAEKLIRVSLQLAYSLCPSTAVPEFALIVYKRIDGPDKRDSLRKNLKALMSAAAEADIGDVIATAADADTPISPLPTISETPPRSCTPTQTQQLQLTPISTSIATSSTGRKRKAAASKDRKALQNRRKAMRRLRL